ncbi:aspartokinase [Gracilibacillus boraciitolerans JCM 21714]|uniref:Aspartokinase n=1 Tax=Gracilibacillus boraciitolerans JCM 21714 TaxID=1298598 RepID=W4VDH7_9BACI|nr:aspartokinase [Gracilibacillus boraciitolerans JCM 21714]
MKVAKFGGSSVANAEQLQKVAQIIKDDKERKVIVVSAPGKRFSDDVKVTDLLIELGGVILPKATYRRKVRNYFRSFSGNYDKTRVIRLRY